MVFYIERDNEREKQLRKKYGIIDKYANGEINEKYTILENTSTINIKKNMVWELIYNCLCLKCGQPVEYTNSSDNSKLLTKYERTCIKCNIKITISVKHTSQNELRKFRSKIYSINKERKENNAKNRVCPFCMQWFGRFNPSLSYNENISDSIELTKCRICGTEIILDKESMRPLLVKFYVDKDNIYRFNEYIMDYDNTPILSLRGLDIKTAYKKYKEKY